MPGGETRGGHAHRQLEQLVIAVSGSFDVIVDDGTQRERFFLNRSYYGLYIPRDDLARARQLLLRLGLPGRWPRELYDEADYYRDYDEFPPPPTPSATRGA